MMKQAQYEYMEWAIYESKLPECFSFLLMQKVMTGQMDLDDF